MIPMASSAALQHEVLLCGLNNNAPRYDVIGRTVLLKEEDGEANRKEEGQGKVLDDGSNKSTAQALKV